MDRDRFTVLNRLYQFARAQHLTLTSDHNKHKSGWRGMSYEALRAKLEEEYYEVKAELSFGAQPDPVRLAKEAIDLANLAFMLWERAMPEASRQMAGQPATPRDNAAMMLPEAGGTNEYVEYWAAPGGGSTSMSRPEALESVPVQADTHLATIKADKLRDIVEGQRKPGGVKFAGVDGVPNERIENIREYLNGEPMRITEAASISEPSVAELHRRREKAQHEARQIGRGEK